MIVKFLSNNPLQSRGSSLHEQNEEEEEKEREQNPG
jgi:hypothetical protein